MSLKLNTPGNSKDDAEMNFLDHLEELRWHIIRSIAWILFFAIGAFVAKDFVFGTLIFGPKNNDFLSYQLLCKFSKAIGAGESMCIVPPKFNLQAVEFGELFTTHLKASFFVGLAAAFPFILWEFWKFIKPGLYDNEQKAARGFVFVCSALFLIGACFGYFVISPFAVTFLAGYEIEGAIAQPSLTSFVNYMVMFTIPVGLVFELPILVYFLSKIGIVTPDFMRTYRRHAAVLILISAAIITPPDVITQFLVGIPLFILYEISIYISAMVVKRQKQEFDNSQALQKT